MHLTLIIVCPILIVVIFFVIKGTILVGLELLDGGDWCQGYVLNHDNMQKGIFPTSYCWQLDTFAYLKPEDTRDSKNKILKFAQVVHAMTAQLEEEIDLSEGQLVVITEVVDKDWYRYLFLDTFLLHVVFISQGVKVGNLLFDSV